MSVATDTARVGSSVGSPNIKRLLAGGIIAAVVAAVAVALLAASGSGTTQMAPGQIAQLRAAQTVTVFEAQAAAAQAAAQQARETDRLHAASQIWSAGLAPTTSSIETPGGQPATDWQRVGVSGPATYTVYELLRQAEAVMPKPEPVGRPSYLDQIEDVQFGTRSPAITVPYSGVVGPN